MAIHDYSCAEPPAPEPHVPEELIQRLWEQLAFPRDRLKTTTGKSVQIHHPGDVQHDAGPDFTGARLVIDRLTWHGDVEIHRYSSDWYKHGHQDDTRFNSVILHVSLYKDTQTGHLQREDGTVLPEIVLADYLTKPVWRFIQPQSDSATDLPCAHLWPSIEEEVGRKWLRQLGEERIRQRMPRAEGDHIAVPDLELWLYRKLFRALGYSKNADQMERLAQLVPLDVVRNTRNKIDLEAVYLGTAGLLPGPSEAADGDTAAVHYLYNARNSYRGIQLENELPQMETANWTFFRLRPANFPTLRIAQASALLADQGILWRDPLPRLQSALDADDPLRATRALLQATPSTFWETHVRLTAPTGPFDPSLGVSRKDKLIENAIVPLLLLDARQRGDEDQRSASLDLLRSVPASSDSITRKFKKNGATISDGLLAQGAHQLYRTRCQRSRCFDCKIGSRVLKPSS